MFTCERCGAGLPPNTDQCGYCGTVSGAARAALAAEAAHVGRHPNRRVAGRHGGRDQNRALLSARFARAGTAENWA